MVSPRTLAATISRPRISNNTAAAATEMGSFLEREEEIVEMV